MENIRLFFAGDFCSKPSTSHITVSEELRSVLERSDLRIINFEVPLMPEPTLDNVTFYQHDDAPAFLRNLGFDLFSFANNHAFDCGDAGFQKTVAALENRTFGSGTYAEAYQVKTMEINGIRLGFMALSYAAMKGVFDRVGQHNGLGCAYLHDLRVNHDIMAAKKEVDYLFVLPHDGIEYIDVPLPETIARYRDFIDYGADAVIGTHPHCPQGWETYKGKTIFYSLGNFFFNSKATPDFRADKPHWYEGLCAIANIGENGISFETLNTRNRENRTLEVDHDECREMHNAQTCRYLQDKEAYENYLWPVIEKIAIEQEAAIVERFTLRKPFKTSVKNFIKKLRTQLKGQSATTQRSLLHLLKNDARRQTLMHILEKQ